MRHETRRASRVPAAVHAGGPRLHSQGPSRFEWVVAVFAVLVQQGAFLSIPLFFGNNTLLIRQDENQLNTVAVALSLVSIVGLCIWQARRIGALAARNPFSLLFLGLVFASVIWSIHHGITVRRSVGYLLTILVAAYLVCRFDVTTRMKVLSLGFAIAAIGSFLFVAVFPGDGIMQVGELAGTWRGVFPHKNVLGPVMAAGVFVELFILVSNPPRSRWRYLLLASYLALVVLSHSATALLLAAAYTLGAGIYLCWKRSPRVGAMAALAVASVLGTALLVFVINPNVPLALLGKDATFTGRTNVWSYVLSMIEQRPVLGYGYRAFWVLNDPTTLLADQATGGWGVGNSHNTYLELTLQLGVVGLTSMLIIALVALTRAYRCMRRVSGPLGFFALLYISLSLVAGFVMETLGQNQVIEWVLFNLLMFGCAEALASKRRLTPRNQGAVSVASTNAPV